jgi:hypothetical protein
MEIDIFDHDCINRLDAGHSDKCDCPIRFHRIRQQVFHDGLSRRAEMKKLVIASLMVLTLMLPNVAQAEEFRLYNALLFSLYYPASWTISQNGDIKKGTVIFRSDTDQAMAWISWNPKSQWFSTDKDYWESAGYGWMSIMVDNESYFLNAQPAIAILQTNGTHQQEIFVTNVNGTTYTLYYDATVDNYLTHWSQFQVMVASFRVGNSYNGINPGPPFHP